MMLVERLSVTRLISIFFILQFSYGVVSETADWSARLSD